jgi:hypothetical protein
MTIIQSVRTFFPTEQRFASALPSGQELASTYHKTVQAQLSVERGDFGLLKESAERQVQP